MKYVSAMLLKLFMILIVLSIILGLFYNVAMDDILTISMVLTGFSFVIGDLLILLRSSNATATIADFVISFLVILALGSLLFEGPIPLLTATFISALGLTVVEIIYHQYLRSRVLDDDKPFKISKRRYHYQTEFSEELDSDKQQHKK